MALKHEQWDEPDWEKPKPPRRNDPGAVLFFLVGAAIVLAALFVPSVSRPLRKMLQPPQRPALDLNATVWVQKDAGDYYCPESTMYGHGSGSYMKQGEALTVGYQPALGVYCNEPKKDALHSRSVPQQRGDGSQLPAAQPRNSTVLAAPRP
jgi:hypothetical protein